MSETPSPCQTICKVDAGRRMCIGCGRTLDEIAAWPTANEEQRRAIVAQLPERLRNFLSKQIPDEKR